MKQREAELQRFRAEEDKKDRALVEAESLAMQVGCVCGGGGMGEDGWAGRYGVE
jgi:hypothetical protein